MPSFISPVRSAPGRCACGGSRREVRNIIGSKVMGRRGIGPRGETVLCYDCGEVLDQWSERNSRRESDEGYSTRSAITGY